MAKGLISLCKSPNEKNINQLAFAVTISEFFVKVIRFIDAYVEGASKRK